MLRTSDHHSSYDIELALIKTLATNKHHQILVLKQDSLNSILFALHIGYCIIKVVHD